MKTAEAARAAMIEGRGGFMAHLRAGTLAEDNIGGAKLDVENTPKCTRLNCILPQKSRLLGLVMIIMMMTMMAMMMILVDEQ